MRVPALVEFSMPGRLLTTGCVAAAALAVAHAQQQPPTFGTTTRTVAVYATVTDPHGRLAPDENLLILVDQFEEIFRFARASSGDHKDDAAGFVKLMVGLWLDAAIILGVVVINALLGFIQEGKAEKALNSIRNMLSAEARTLRGGETRMVPAEALVPGDVVLLESGDKLPADLRLIAAKNLRTEEAALTGESVPIDKTTDPVSEKATVGDREGMAFSGTLVASGRGTGVVVATGADTELGRINQMIAAVSSLETPLLRQIKKFGYAITALIAVVVSGATTMVMPSPRTVMAGKNVVQYVPPIPGRA